MSEYKKEIGVAGAIAVIVALGIGLFAFAAFPNGQTTATSPGSQTTTSMVGPTQVNNLNLQGPVSLVTLNPQNTTFTLTYVATTLSSPVNLSFNLSESYVNIYTNGTEWISLSRPCTSATMGSQSSVSESATVVTTTVATASEIPCGEPPGSGFAPVNGTVVDRYAKLGQDEISVSISPSSIPAGQTENLQITIALHLKPGVYVLGVFFGVESSGPFEYASLQPFPVVVNA
jgi:hypothetical protein